MMSLSLCLNNFFNVFYDLGEVSGSGGKGGGGCTNACLCMGSLNHPLLTEPLHIQVRPNYVCEGSLLWQTILAHLSRRLIFGAF